MFRTVNVRMHGALGAALCVMLGSAAATATAQTVANATTAEFQPSSDHGAIDPAGTPLVTTYLLQFFPVGSATSSHAIDIGKPVPGADGLIRFPFTSRLTTPSDRGTIYRARVSAVGPGGTVASALSNTFTASRACSPSLSASAATIAAAASTGSVSVTAGTGCAWTASSRTRAGSR